MKPHQSIVKKIAFGHTLQTHSLQCSNITWPTVLCCFNYTIYICTIISSYVHSHSYSFCIKIMLSCLKLNQSSVVSCFTTAVVLILMWRTHTHTHVLHAHICTHAYMHTCTHAHMHTCTHTHMHTCTHGAAYVAKYCDTISNLAWYKTSEILWFDEILQLICLQLLTSCFWRLQLLLMNHLGLSPCASIYLEDCQTLQLSDCRLLLILPQVKLLSNWLHFNDVALYWLLVLHAWIPWNSACINKQRNSYIYAGFNASS